MKNLQIGLSFALIFFLSITACKKLNFKPAGPKKLAFDSYQLPVLANNGEGYFGFLCDEKPVWGQKQSFIDGSIKLKYNVKENLMELGFNHKLQSVFIYLRTAQLKVGETYALKGNLFNSTASSADYYESSAPVDNGNGISWSEGFIYNSHDNKPGYIKISYLNTEKQIIAGEFEIPVMRRGINQQEKNITKGRFDATYKLLN
ncbi:MAG: hypothetical protein EOO47_12035 [Flavobacterium sp.]|nr:MAG: hypothetical protein EOO47_12035 [Flavobacterium sp.]